MDSPCFGCLGAKFVVVVFFKLGVYPRFFVLVWKARVYSGCRRMGEEDRCLELTI
jgi:hypothetical protein